MKLLTVRLHFSIAALLVVVSMTTSSLAIESPYTRVEAERRLNETPPLRFGYVSQNIPPYITQENETISGVDFDIAKKLAGQVERDISAVPYPNYRELLLDLDRGMIDFSIQDPAIVTEYTSNIWKSNLIYSDELVVIHNRGIENETAKLGCIITEVYCKNLDGIIPVFSYYDVIRLLDDDIISKAIIPYTTFLSNNIVADYTFLPGNLKKSAAFLLGKELHYQLADINELIRSNTTDTDFWSNNLDFQYSQLASTTQSHRVLRYTIENDIYPALYIDPVTLAPSGYVVDILNYIHNRTLLSFEHVPISEGQNAETMLKDGAIDFLAFAGIHSGFLDSALGWHTVNYTTVNFVRVKVKESSSKVTGVLARTQRSERYFDSLLLNEGEIEYFDDLTSLLDAVMNREVGQLVLSQEVMTPNLILNSSQAIDIKSIEEIAALPIGMIFNFDVENEFGYMNHFLRTLDEKLLSEYRGKYTGDGYYFGVHHNLFYTALVALLIISLFIFILYRAANGRLKVDLEKEKNAKEKTDQMLKWFTSLLEDIPVGLVLTDSDGKKVISNRQYREYQQHYDIDKIVYENGHQTQSYADKNTHFTYRTVPFIHPSDNSNGFLTIWTDVTSIEEQRLALLESNRVANQALSARSKFTAMITHELRTPIAGIVGLLEVLESGNQSRNETKSIIKSLKSSALELNQHVDEILDISKSESGEMTLDPHSCNLLAEIDSITKQYQALCIKRGIHFVVAFHPTEWVFGFTDAKRIRQIISNVLSNAVKFTHKGTVTIEIKLLSGLLEIDISDTGIGMTLEELTHLYEPYVQADLSISRQYGGTGLGMTIVKGLVDLFKGSVNVSSKTEVGTHVQIKLPITTISFSSSNFIGTNTNSYAVNRWLKALGLYSEQSKFFPVSPSKTRQYLDYPSDLIADVTAAHRSSDSLPKPEQLRGHVLIAEDSASIRLLLDFQMKSFGLTTDIYSCGITALEAFQNEPEKYDLMLTDCRMPGMSGFELTERVKALKSSISVIGLTAETASRDHRFENPFGFEVVIVKPYPAEELYLAVSQHLPKGEVKGQQKSVEDSIDVRQNQLDELSKVVVESYRQEIEWLESGEQSDKEILHRLKGSASLLGFHNVTELIRSLGERALSGEERQSVIRALTEIIDEQSSQLRE